METVQKYDHYTHPLCLKKRLDFYILNNLAKNEPTLIVFGVLSHHKIKNSPTSPE